MTSVHAREVDDVIMRLLQLALITLALVACRSTPSISFPVTPQLFIDSFRASEGLTFNAEGKLFIGANTAIWIAEPDGSVRQIADVHTHLGQAGFGERDILAADFGPTNVFRHGPTTMGSSGGSPRRAKRASSRPASLTRVSSSSFQTGAHGRIYIADNGAGKIFRFDPRTGEVILIAEGMTAVASLVFGEGEFDHYALYATSTQRGGGKVWKIPVGVRGARLHR